MGLSNFILKLIILVSHHMISEMDSHQSVLMTTNSSCMQQDGEIQELNLLVAAVEPPLQLLEPFQRF